VNQPGQPQGPAPGQPGGPVLNQDFFFGGGQPGQPQGPAPGQPGGPQVPPSGFFGPAPGQPGAPFGPVGAPPINREELEARFGLTPFDPNAPSGQQAPGARRGFVPGSVPGGPVGENPPPIGVVDPFELAAGQVKAAPRPSFLNPIIDDQAPDHVSAGGDGTADGIGDIKGEAAKATFLAPAGTTVEVPADRLGDIKGEAVGPTFLDPDSPGISASPDGSTFLAPAGISMNIPD
jgi:hypothetical protein